MPSYSLPNWRIPNTNYYITSWFIKKSSWCRQSLPQLAPPAHRKIVYPNERFHGNQDGLVTPTIRNRAACTIQPKSNYSTFSGNNFSCAMHTPDSTLERGMLPPNSLPAVMPMEEPQEIRIPHVMSLPSRDECDSMMVDRSVASQIINTKLPLASKN